MRKSVGDLKRKQLQLFCGRYTPTSGGLRNPTITEELIQSILQNWRKYETIFNWQLVDCKQNVQAYADISVNLG